MKVRSQHDARGPRLLAAGLLASLSLLFGIAAAATSLDSGAVASPAVTSSEATAEPPAITHSTPDAPAPADALDGDEASGGPPDADERPATDERPTADADERPAPARPEPTRVQVASVGIDATLEPVSVDEEQRLVVPPPERAGWFDGRVEPGRIGPAVLVGHVDSRDGPAVFHGLDRAVEGDLVEVTDEAGDRVTFEVERIEVTPKSDFPTSDVYDPVDRAELRLITCGGPFDQDARSYRDNVIVYAVAVDDDGGG